MTTVMWSATTSVCTIFYMVSCIFDLWSVPLVFCYISLSLFFVDTTAPWTSRFRAHHLYCIHPVSFTVLGFHLFSSLLTATIYGSFFWIFAAPSSSCRHHLPFCHWLSLVVTSSSSTSRRTLRFCCWCWHLSAFTFCRVLLFCCDIYGFLLEPSSILEHPSKW